MSILFIKSLAVDDITKKYKSLRNSSALTTEQETELVNIQSELIRLIPSLTTMQDAYGNATLVSVNLLEKELALINAMSVARAISEFAKLSDEMKKASDGIDVITGRETSGFLFWSTTEAIKKLGQKSIYFAADVTVEKQVKNMVNYVMGI